MPTRSPRFTELGDCLGKPVRSCSTGMRFRLGFAVCPSFEAEMVLMQGGLAVGDPTLFLDKALLRLEALADGARSVVLARQSRELLRGVCRTAVVLDAGRVLAAGRGGGRGRWLPTERVAGCDGTSAAGAFGARRRRIHPARPRVWWMMPLLRYTPEPVHLPPEASLARTFRGHELDAGQRALYDTETVFYDVFLAAGKDELVCVGPPFRNLGRPRAVRLRGESLRFAIQEAPWGMKRAAVVRVDLGGLDAGVDRGAVGLRVEFRTFAVDASLNLAAPTPLARVAVTLATLQKDNDAQWLFDWCAWHRRAHGVDRIIVYDNGSDYATDVYAELSMREAELELVVVDWRYSFGPARPHALKFAKTGALNHCRLRFGRYTDWCINTDVDEYIVNASPAPLASRLGRMRRPLVDLPSYIVPFVVDKAPRRCFDSPWRCARLELRARKYVYRPDGTRFNENHYCMVHGAGDGTPRLRRTRRVVKRVLALCGIDWRPLWARLKAAAPGRAARRYDGGRLTESAIEGEPELFFFHFRALNTGWKRPPRLVAVDAREHVLDERIAAMEEIVDGPPGPVRGGR